MASAIQIELQRIKQQLVDYANATPAPQPVRYKAIPDCPDYQITSTGEVWSYKYSEPKQLNPRELGSGILITQIINKHGKQTQYQIHELVAAAFVTNPRRHKFVIYLDDNKLNNHASNLAWREAV